MLAVKQFGEFFNAIEEDPYINTTHIALYMALLQHWQAQQFVNPMHVFSHVIMPIAKISSGATYHKKIRELSDLGYIRYEPSFKRNQASKIYMFIP